MTQARYQVHIYSPADGSRIAVLTDWRTLFLERTVNGIDNLTLALDAADPNIQFFTLDALLEVRRRIDRPGADWYTECVLLNRTPRNEVTSAGGQIFTSYSRGLTDLLHRRNLLYYANTTYTLKSAPADDVMKEIVRENCSGSSNVSARRSYGTYNPTLKWLSVQANSGEAPVWAGTMPWKNVLDQIQDIALASGCDFNVVRNGSQSFEFITNYPQLGIDRTAEVMFSLRFGNMSNMVLTKSRTEEATVVAVLGQGEEAARNVIIRGPTAAAEESPWNIIETIKDSRNSPSILDLQKAGDQTLEEVKAQDNFEFVALQTDPRQYGQHAEYWFGDKIKAEFGGITVTKKITGVKLSMQEGQESVSLDFSDNISMSGNPLLAVVQNLTKRLRRLETQEPQVSAGLVF